MTIFNNLYIHDKKHDSILSTSREILKSFRKFGKVEEEKIELSPVETMALLGWKKSKVYYWISSGKFETVQRIDGEKIVINKSDIDRLKNKPDSEQIESNSENFEEVQKSSVQNFTKNYNQVQNNLSSETFEFFNKSLETIKQMHQSSLQNYGYSLKLLTDGKTAIEQENIELKQEKKAVEESLKKSEKEFQEKLKQFEKVQKEKNIIIAILVFIILLVCLVFFLVQNSFVQF